MVWLVTEYMAELLHPFNDHQLKCMHAWESASRVFKIKNFCILSFSHHTHTTYWLIFPKLCDVVVVFVISNGQNTSWNWQANESREIGLGYTSIPHSRVLPLIYTDSSPEDSCCLSWITCSAVHICGSLSTHYNIHDVHSVQHFVIHWQGTCVAFIWESFTYVVVMYKLEHVMLLYQYGNSNIPRNRISYCADSCCHSYLSPTNSIEHSFIQ